MKPARPLSFSTTVYAINQIYARAVFYANSNTVLYDIHKCSVLTFSLRRTAVTELENYSKALKTHFQRASLLSQFKKMEKYHQIILKRNS